MQIIMKPVFKTCKCEICGTGFRLEAGDEMNTNYRMTVAGEIVDKTLYAVCPVCGFKYIPLEIDGYEYTERG